MLPVIFKHTISSRTHAFPTTLLALLSVLLISGCSRFVSFAAVDLVNNLTDTVINTDDLSTIETGGPAYLLMIDSLLRSDPNNASLLRSAANLYTAYAAVFVKDRVRAKKLTGKGLHYAIRAVCLQRMDACLSRDGSFHEFSDALKKMTVKDVPALYVLGTAWAGWIKTRVDDWNAIAEISRVEAIMHRVVQLNEFYQDGEAHMYLGIFSTLLPPALGGKPELGRSHFERAMEISGNKNLMVKVTYARQYARLVFDRELHDRLLKEVLGAEPHVPGHVLVNMVARQQAKELLDSADDYFN